VERYHEPVLLAEVIDFIGLKEGGVYADLTFGEGGHTSEMLKRGVAKVVAVDRDNEALSLYRESGEMRQDPRLELHHSRYSRFPEVAAGRKFDGILIDLGVSTRQLLRAERGFSFAEAGPLDMRMDKEGDASLADRLAELEPEELADSLYRNADLKNSRSLARKIIERARGGRLATTLDLAAVAGPKHGKRHPATPLFLALRMLVNEELDEIANGIPPLLDCLKDGGRLAVITFHSTEDREVKRLFNLLGGKCICGEAFCTCPREQRVRILTKKPVEATPAELERNPRARSAKLRCVEKVAP